MKIELKDCTEHLKGKTIYCNCDNTEWSNLYLYFLQNFEVLDINSLLSTHYVKDENFYSLEKTIDGEVKTNLTDSKNFRSQEYIELLKKSDIVFFLK